MCKKMCNENVCIYVVVFKVLELVKKMLKNCMGDDSLFFDVGNGVELLVVYDVIVS